MAQVLCPRPPADLARFGVILGSKGERWVCLSVGSPIDHFSVGGRSGSTQRRLVRPGELRSVHVGGVRGSQMGAKPAARSAPESREQSHRRAPPVRETAARADSIRRRSTAIFAVLSGRRPRHPKLRLLLHALPGTSRWRRPCSCTCYGGAPGRPERRTMMGGTPFTVLPQVWPAGYSARAVRRRPIAAKMPTSWAGRPVTVPAAARPRAATPCMTVARPRPDGA